MDYSAHYCELAKRGQYGYGIPGFHGVVRYQGGRGIFKSIFRSAIVPALKFLGKTALSTGANIASDTILNKRNFKESAKEHLENAGKEIASTGLQAVKRKLVGGKIRKNKRLRKSIKRLSKQDIETLKFL